MEYIPAERERSQGACPVIFMLELPPLWSFIQVCVCVCVRARARARACVCDVVHSLRSAAYVLFICNNTAQNAIYKNERYIYITVISNILLGQLISFVYSPPPPPHPRLRETLDTDRCISDTLENWR